MNSKKITSRKPLRQPLEFQQQSVIDKNEGASSSISVASEISTCHESKMNLRKRKASELEQVEEDNIFEEDMSQKEKDELSKVLELSRISSKREAEQRSKQQPVEDLTKSKIIADSEHSSLEEDIQLSGSQSLFDSSKEDDNSNNTQLSQSLIHKNDDDAPDALNRPKNRLQLKKHKIDGQLSPELPSKVRRISDSSESSRTHSPVFGLETSAKSPIQEKRLINLRRENLQVIMKWGLLYPPPGVDMNSYTTHIINLLNNYEINLQKFQLQSFNKLDWPKAVVNGPHYPNTIDLRRRGDKPTIQITDDDSDNESKQPKNEKADRLRAKAQENGQSIEALKFDDTELPDIVVENSQKKNCLGSIPDSLPLSKAQEVVPEQPITESLMNFLGKAFEIDNKDWLSSQENDSQMSESKLLQTCRNSTNDKKNCSNRDLLKEDISPPVPINSPVMERSNKLLEKEIEEASPNRKSSPESSQILNHQEETLKTSEHENSEIRKSLTFCEEKKKTLHPEDVIACPLCNNMYVVNEIEEHAAGCEGSSEIRVSHRETKSLRRRGLPMERILQEIHSVSSDDFDNSSQENIGIPVKSQRSFSPATISMKMKKLIEMKRKDQIDESLEKCYVCGGFFPEGEPYAKHVKDCICSESGSGESSSQLISPRSKDNMQLLKQLESDSDEDIPPLLKKKVASDASFSQPAISTSDSVEINISGLKISSSPVKGFRAISSQQDNLIEFKKQFKSQQRPKEEKQYNYGRKKKNIKRVHPKKKQKF